MPTFSVDLSQQVAIVTGGGGDLGRAIALALAASGAAVTVNDLNPDRCEDTAQAINDAGGRAIGFQGDISNRFQASAMIEATRDAFKNITILINAAGSYKADRFVEIDEWDWRRQIDVMLTGTLFCTQLVGRVMADQGENGVIVNVASNAVRGSLEAGVGYMAAKTGIIGLTRQAARELAAAGVRVNAVCPGNFADDYSSPPLAPNMMNRAGTYEEVADAVLFLCSDAARFITGQALHVDGGGLI